jgi:DNA-binding transcriptional MerR regulator
VETAKRRSILPSRKSKDFPDHLTISELAIEVSRDPKTIKKLERQGILPAPPRIRRGGMMVRLYSPALVEEIRVIFQGRKRGRKKKLI